MNIAVLGWGSLIWDPRELSITCKWRKDGPMLPIEFARKSGGERLTLVIHPYEGVKPVATYWAYSAFKDPKEAIENLRKREGTASKHIGVWRTDRDTENPSDDITITIAKWQKRRAWTL